MPHLAIAEALVRRGHRVSFYAEPAAAKNARLVGCTPIEVPEGNVLRRLFGATTTAHFVGGLDYLNQRVAPHLARVLARGRFDGVVVDCMHLGAALAAQASGLPWASVALTPSLLSPMGRKGAQNQLPNLALRKKLGLPPSETGSLEQGNSPLLHLLAWSDEFDLRATPKSWVHLGPLNWEIPTPPPAWARKLGKKRPLVLVALSTFPLDALEDANRWYAHCCIQGLGTLPVDAVVTYADQYPEEVPGNVRIDAEIRHSQILPRASLLISQGGWGILSRAMARGIPALTVPMAMDQAVGARLARKAGFGHTVALARLSPKALANAAARLLDDRCPERRAATGVARKVLKLGGARQAARLVSELLR